MSNADKYYKKAQSLKEALNDIHMRLYFDFGAYAAFGDDLQRYPQELQAAIKGVEYARKYVDAITETYRLAAIAEK